jgi:hypothetical protein
MNTPNNRLRAISPEGDVIVFDTEDDMRAHMAANGWTSAATDALLSPDVVNAAIDGHIVRTLPR